MTREDFIRFLDEMFEATADIYGAEIRAVSPRIDGLDVVLMDGTTFEIDVRRNGQFVP